MKLGTFSHFGFNLPVEERLTLISKSGFTHVFAYLDDAEELAQNNDHINKYLSNKFSLSLDSLHASYENANLVWSDKEEDRQKIYHYYQGCLDFCSKHDVPNLVIHPIKTDSPPKFNQAGLELFASLSSEAEKKNVRIALENTRTNKYVSHLLEEIGSEFLGLCYDTSHDNLYGDPTLSLLDKWIDRLSVLHISDNLGKEDDHMLPFEGTFDWEGFATIMRGGGRNCILMMESFSQEEHSDSKGFLREGIERLLRLNEMIG